jgi:hypothetical protein
MKRRRIATIQRSLLRRAEEVIESPWAIQRSNETARRSRVHARIRQALQTAERLGVPFESVYRDPVPRRNRPDRIVFLHGPTKQRLVLDRDGGNWIFEWQSQRQPLNNWTQISTPDGHRWIVTAPRPRTDGGRDTTYPYEPHPGLNKVLFDGWYGAMTVGSRPECADQRPHAIKAAQIIKALAEAVERGGIDAEKLIDKLETVGGRYLKTLTFKSKPTLMPWHGQGLKLVLDRPAALQGLAKRLLRHLPPDDEADSALAVAGGLIRDLREGSSYAKVAADLPKLASAGAVEAKQIAALYVEASDAVRAKRRALLCEKCAPGTGGLGQLGERGSHYASPIPGDRDGWGCRGTTAAGTICGPMAESSVNRERWEIAQNLLCAVAAVLGFPPRKARHLFSFEDKRAKRRRSDTAAAPRAAET